jgi:predicted metal-dependent peptidase
MSAEQIYNLLESEEDTDPDSDDDQQAPPSTDRNSGPDGSELNEPSAPETHGGIGQVLDAPVNAPGESADSPTEQEQAREWEIAVKQAMTVAQQAGKMPAGLDRTMEGAAEAAVNWRELLRRLWSETTAADYSWMRPNRRHLWRGLYLPGVVKEGVGEIVIAVDCSGSISGRQLRLFEAEARSILEGQRPERVYVLYFDAVVQKVEIYEAGQPISLNPVGGGGTEFSPCFEWVEERGIIPQTVIFLTDLYGSFPSSAPYYPVLWASTGRRQAPFGEVIPMQSA